MESDKLKELKKLRDNCKVMASPGWTAAANSAAIVAVIDWIIDLEESTEPEVAIVATSKPGSNHK